MQKGTFHVMEDIYQWQLSNFYGAGSGTKCAKDRVQRGGRMASMLTSGIEQL